MRKIVALWLLVTALCLGACNQDALVAKFTPHPEAEMAKRAIDDWREGRIAELRAMLAPSVQSEVTDAQFATWAAEFPKGEPRSVKVVGASTFVHSGEHRYDLTYEYEFDGKWLVASAVVVRHGDEEAKIEGIQAKLLDRSLEQINAFTFQNKGGLHLLMLFLSVASPLVSIAALIVCIRTPMRRRKVLWALFTLVGVSTVHFNWTTGQSSFMPISFQIFGASAVSTPYGPWMLGVSLPLGAIVFFLRRKALMVRQ